MYGSVRTVVWQGSVGDRRPYADLTGKPEVEIGTYGNDTRSKVKNRREATCDSYL